MVHDTACAGTADKTILAPAIHIPSSHPGHQTKKHSAAKGGSISRDEIKKKNAERDPQISQIFADGKKGVHRGGRRVRRAERQRIGYVSGATCWLAQQCLSIGTPCSRLHPRSSHSSRTIKIRCKQHSEGIGTFGIGPSDSIRQEKLCWQFGQPRHAHVRIVLQFFVPPRARPLPVACPINQFAANWIEMNVVDRLKGRNWSVDVPVITGAFLPVAKGFDTWPLPNGQLLQ